jgi:Protein of unknown function (DUF4038)
VDELYQVQKKPHLAESPQTDQRSVVSFSNKVKAEADRLAAARSRWYSGSKIHGPVSLFDSMRCLTLCGALACVSVALAAGPYPVRVGTDHRHVVDQSGAPFLIHGDTPWSLISGLTKEEAEQYLENRRQKGFNSIIVNLIEHKFRGPVNRYGEEPFTTPGDFSTPNGKYFEHADWVIRKAGEKRMQVFLAPIYLGYIGTDEGWIEEALATVRRSATPGGNMWGSVTATTTTWCG